MTLQEWREVAAMMNLLYDDGKLMFSPDDKAKLMAWYSCLSDLDYEGTAKAVRNLVMKSPYKPKVADIRREYANITQEVMMTEHEAWLMVRDGIRNGTYGSAEEFEKFPPMVQQAVVDASSLREWAQLPSDEVETVIQSLFKRQFRAVTERVAEDRVVGQLGTKSGEMARLSQSVAERIGMKNE